MAYNSIDNLGGIRAVSRYMDGESARPRSVITQISDSIVITANNNAADGDDFLAEWHFEDLQSHDGPSHILILSNSKNDDFERLEIHDETAIRAIKDAAPNMAKKRKSDRNKNRKVAALSIAALLSAVVIIIIAIPAIADRLAPLVPLSAEQKLGDSFKDQIAKSWGFESLDAGTCHSPDGDAALAKILKIAQQDTKFPFPIDLRVVKHPVPNAFALPGGHVVFLSSLIDMADDPDQVTGVLAHELGHVMHRDSMRLILQTTGRSFFFSLLLGDFTGSTVVLFGAQTLLNSSYSRQVETEADIFAIEQLQKANVATKPLGVLLTRITQQMGGEGHHHETKGKGEEPKAESALWDSHPLTSDRMAMLEEATTNADTVPSLTKDEWQALKNICEKH